MIRDDVCYLISESPSPHGLFDTVTRTERMVYCRVNSVGSAEFWRGKTAGVDLSIVFVLSDYLEYQGEKLIRWGDRLYSVVRTYVNQNEIEISCEEAGAYVDTESAVEPVDGT